MPGRLINNFCGGAFQAAPEKAKIVGKSVFHFPMFSISRYPKIKISTVNIAATA